MGFNYPICGCGSICDGHHIPCKLDDAVVWFFNRYYGKGSNESNNLTGFSTQETINRTRNTYRYKCTDFAPEIIEKISDDTELQIGDLITDKYNIGTSVKIITSINQGIYSFKKFNIPFLVLYHPELKVEPKWRINLNTDIKDYSVEGFTKDRFIDCYKVTYDKIDMKLNKEYLNKYLNEIYKRAGVKRPVNQNWTLKQQLKFYLNIPEENFGSHLTDLYVLKTDGLKEWLKENYPFYKNIKYSTGAKGSDWAYKPMYDIPFAYMTEKVHGDSDKHKGVVNND